MPGGGCVLGTVVEEYGRLESVAEVDGDGARMVASASDSCGEQGGRRWRLRVDFRG